jgi:fructose-specific component phosphotransferase system IIB-like protein
MRGSSVHFKRIASAIHAVSHANRDAPPDYLLPADMSQGSHVVIEDNGQVQKMLEHKMHLASRQAKATKDYSPLWEGVINLPEPSSDVTPERQISIVQQWCKEYEAMTGHKVLRADVHLDEGFVDEAGKPHFNAHAHVMCDRTDDKGRVKKLTSTVLREVQNMTAEVTTLARGLDARQTHRKHINHHNFKFDAEKNRIGLDKEKSKSMLEGRLTDTLSRSLKDTKEKLKEAQQEATQQAQELAQLKEQYRLDREALKASGEAKQADYQALKKAHEAALEKLKDRDFVIGNLLKNEAALHEKVTTMTAENKALQNDLEATKARFAAMANDYQAEKAAGTPAHMVMPTKETNNERNKETNIAPAPLSSPSKPKPAKPVPPVATEATKTASEAPKPQTHPTPSPAPKKQPTEAAKPPEPVFPRLTEPEFEELAGKVKLPERIQAAAKDVLVHGLLVAAAALIQKIMPGTALRALEKLLANYIAPEPPAPAIEPVKAQAKPLAPGRGGVGR